MDAEKRGSIAFFSTYRPPVPLDIFSSPVPPVSVTHERQMTDQVSYNYNGQSIPMESLKKIFDHRKLASPDTADAMAFVSERETLETLHLAVYPNNGKPNVFSFSYFYDKIFSGIRMEDSARFAGDYLIYISTTDPFGNKIQFHRQPWTAVYKLNLSTGKNELLTPPGQADLSPSVSPSGKKIAVASFQNKGGWKGEIEDLKTDIYVMNIDEPFERTLVIENGGWPTWGSNDVIFFHRVDKNKKWGVFRANISKGVVSSDGGDRVTPEGTSAMTPAAINATTVAVAIIRQPSSDLTDIRVEAQYRHIEVFDSTKKQGPIEITRKIKPKSDHFNPFVLDGGRSIGYHRCRSDVPESKKLVKVRSPDDDVGLFRSPGAFPTFTKDGTKFAFVDNEFKAVFVGDTKGNLDIAKQYTEVDSVFSPVWNQDPIKDTLYICVGHSFQAEKIVEIHALPNVSLCTGESKQLTKGGFNNAFPSTNPDGTKFVFRSTRDGGGIHSKSLYIMEDAKNGETGEGSVTRVTHNKERLDGQYSVDTHCEWSPNGDWIVFSSTRDKPEGKPADDNGLDPGYFAVYLVKVNDHSVVLEVIKSGSDYAGHVNHPFFSPDGMSIVVAADLAAVSVDPISLPFFIHSVRPYGDIFTIDIDWENLTDNGKVVNVKTVTRATHSRYENSTCTWATTFSTDQMEIAYDILSEKVKAFTPSCPYVHADGGQGWQMAGQLCIPSRRC
ncbi:hypothetical protein ACHQM5_024464 [Ranunculus cassubicifolius]